MSDDHKDLSEHYDGIVEHDHPLPNWWVTIFYLTVLYSFFYYLHYEWLGGPSSKEELETGISEIQSLQKASASNIGDLAALIIKKDVIQLGERVYKEKCFMCHGDKGQGLIGPNLTDSFWIHGQGKPEDILNLIQKGVGDKGMPAWESVLKPEEQVASVAFVKSLKGTNPANAKAPDGIEVKE